MAEIKPTEYKGYRIMHDNVYSMKKIVAMGKGSVPMKLRGSYTNAKFAQDGIDAYIEQNPTEDKKNGKTEDTAGSK